MQALHRADSSFSHVPLAHPDLSGPGADMQPAKVVLETEGVVSAEVASIPGILHQDLHPDGQPRRPMNAFMIFARHRRPAIQAKEPGLKTGDISKRLSHDWKNLEAADKAHYLHQAKILKDEFQSRFPDYVYKRRPNNAASGRRKSSLSIMVAEKGGSSACSDDRSSMMGSTDMMNPAYQGGDAHSLYRQPWQDAFPPMYDRRDPAAGYHGRPPSAPIRASGAVGYAHSQSPSPFSPHDSNASAPPHYSRLSQAGAMPQHAGPPSPSPYWFNPEDSFGSGPAPLNSTGLHPKPMAVSPTTPVQPPLHAPSYSQSRSAYVGCWPEHRGAPATSELNSPTSTMPPTPSYSTHPHTSTSSHVRTQSLNGPTPVYRQPSPQNAQSRYRQASAPDLHAYARSQPGYEGLYDGRRPDIPEDPQQQVNERELPPLNARAYRFASQGRLLPPDLYHDYTPSTALHHSTGANTYPSPLPSEQQHRSEEPFSARAPPINSHMSSLSQYSTSRGGSFQGGVGVEASGHVESVGSGHGIHEPSSVYHPQPQAPIRTNLTSQLPSTSLNGSNEAHSSGSMSHYDRPFHGDGVSAPYRPSLQ